MALGSVHAAEPTIISGKAMGTTWRVSYRAGAALAPGRELERRIAERLEALEQIFSTYRPASELMRFNAQPAADWVPVSPELIHVAMLSKRIEGLTGGAFDPTVGPLLDLWGLGPKGVVGSLPSQAAIDAARLRVGYHRIATRMDPPALRKVKPDVTADFSSAAKGFAVDQVSALLETLGVRDHLVQVGGDMKAAGANWRVGIEDPESRPEAIAVRVSLRAGTALSTSGNARNVIVRDGKRVGHIIDPRSGRPVESNVVSVTVVHASGAESSALATGLFVFGPERGMPLAERRELAVLYLEREGGTLRKRATPEFERLVRTAE